MIKQWKNVNLNLVYFHVPNSKNDEILTTDGVLLPYADFKKMTSEEYYQKKNTNGGYDYELSRTNERLVKKVVNTDDFTKSSNSINKNTTSPQKTTTVHKPTTVTKKVKVVKEDSVPKKEVVKPTIENKVDNKETSLKDNIAMNVTKIKEMNLFDFFYPKLMLLVSVVCSILSINFTAIYMQRLQSTLIAYAISFAMLVYGLVGSQMARRAKKNNHNLQAFIFGITTVCTIGFSMLSSIDVNYSKYKLAHSVVEEEYNVNDGKKLSYNLLKDELEENKKQIVSLNEDIKFQQTQWVMIWDNEKRQNVLLEGRISSTAQNKISEDNKRIDELTIRNKEINETLMSYAESGVSVDSIESKTDKAKTLTDLVGSMLGVSGNIIQLIFLLIPSFFIDVINLLGISIYVDRFEETK